MGSECAWMGRRLKVLLSILSSEPRCMDSGNGVRTVSKTQAVDHLFVKITEVKKRVPNKKFILGETGWPKGGFNFGSAVPSKENQVSFFTRFVCRARAEVLEYFWFSAFDEEWNPTEKDFNWGVFDKKYNLNDGYSFPVKC